MLSMLLKPTHTARLALLAGLTLASPLAFAQDATQDAAHTHDHSEHAAHAHAEQDQAKFEQDRQAILAMAGHYDVTFHFEETVALLKDYQLKDPYNAKASEWVTVVEDTGDLIRMQHILVVTPKDADPIVVKHWRQDWQHEDQDILAYRGKNTWEHETLRPRQAHGTWTQSVYQTDDSPRYEGVGTWVHTGGSSVWESNPTWRPLPRREYSKRQDYDVLIVRNRHTITPNGWVHEQDNQKVVLNDDHQPKTVIAHETGLNSYTRTEDAQAFAPAEAYWDQTQAYWADVRRSWDQHLAEHALVKIRPQIKADNLRYTIADMAEAVAEAGHYESRVDVIDQTIQKHIAQ